MEPLSPEQLSKLIQRLADSGFENLHYTDQYLLLEEMEDIHQTESKRRSERVMPSERKKQPLDPQEHIKLLTSQVEGMALQIANLSDDLLWHQREIERTEAQVEDWRKRCMQTTHQMMQSSEESLRNMMILALHWSEREALARSLAAFTTRLIEHLEALLSDAPEPATFAMLDQLKEHVKQIYSPPSERVQELLAQVTSKAATGKPSEETTES